jgi:RNA polymerase sigma factor (sigma-70 family)
MRVEYDKQNDDWLLQQYVQSRDQEAFAVLVRRYGPMVWGVCRRIVRHTQDAEDALQATFAVLARKARSIRRQRTIGSWLHQVARRIALRARATVNRRDVVLPVAATITAAVEPVVGAPAVDHTELLDDEIARLPKLLRLPIILCYLEGLTNREAAERLGCPEGTIVSRLARGRDKLRLGLVRRGVIIGGTAALTTLLAESGSAAPLLPELAQAALACGRLPATGALAGGSILSAGAARLATEALRALSLRSLAGVSVIIACGIVGLATLAGMFLPVAVPLGGQLVHNDALGQPAGSGGTPTGLSLEGVWQADDLEFIGGDTPAEHAALSADCRWVISGKTIQFKWQDVIEHAGDFQTDTSCRPYAIDVVPTATLSTALSSAQLRGVFLLDRSALEVCTSTGNARRPDFVRPGRVSPKTDDNRKVRIGLVGFARLRRLDRSFEAENLQGKWVLQHMEAGGDVWPLDEQRRQGARFDNDAYTLYHVQDGKVFEIPGTFTLDPTQPARFMEMAPSGGEPFQCLYEIEGDTLRLAGAAPGFPRPEKYKTEPGQPQMSWIFRRAGSKAVDSPTARPP